VRSQITSTDETISSTGSSATGASACGVSESAVRLVEGALDCHVLEDRTIRVLRQSIGC